MSSNSRARPGPHRTERTEAAVFADIAELCSSPGYVHALAYICHRDNFIEYDTEMKLPDTAKLFTQGRLIRTEITTLIGLVVKNEIDLTLPEPVVMQSYIDRTDALMDELHAAIGAPMFENMSALHSGQAEEKESHRGAVLREAIFTGASRLTRSSIETSLQKSTVRTMSGCGEKKDLAYRRPQLLSAPLVKGRT